MYFVLHFFLSLCTPVPQGRYAYSSCPGWVRRVPHFQTKGTQAELRLHRRCRSPQLPLTLVGSDTELSRITGCSKLNKTTNVCKAKPQEAFKSKECYMLLPGQNNFGRFLFNKRSTAVIICSSISSNNNLLVRGNYKTTT